MAEARDVILEIEEAAFLLDRASAHLGGLVAVIDGAELRARAGEISHQLDGLVRELKDVVAAPSGSRH